MFSSASYIAPVNSNINDREFAALSYESVQLQGEGNAFKGL